VPEQLPREEAGSAWLGNPLDAGCASSLQPVAEAVVGKWELYQILSREEKLGSADLACGVRFQ